MTDPSEQTGADRWVGQTIDGRYRIEAQLGAGGLGMVFHASHLGLDRPVAIKVLHPDLLPNVGLRQRFEREVKTLSRLAHPHIVTLTDSGVIEDGTGYLVMELLEGESLEERLRRGPLDPKAALDVARQVLLGLAEAHAKGVLHRDIKPANVFLTPLADGGVHVKLLDFGLAKVRSDLASDPGAFPTLTADGTIVGTPTYMAPEQAAAATADASSDVYSVGVVLFEMLAGRPPFEGKTKLETIRAHLGAPVPELDDVSPSIAPTPELRALVHKALAKDRTSRYANAREMLAALDALPKDAARKVSGTAATERPPAIHGTEATVSVRSSELVTLDSMPAAQPAKPVNPKKAARVKAVWIAVPLAFVVIAGLAYWLWPEGDPSVQEDPGVDENAVAASGADAGVAPVEVEDNAVAEDSETDPQNPFNASPIPDELREARRAIFHGRWLTRDQVRDVRRYQRAHPDDARASLLLARHHRLQGEWRPAVVQYRAAYRIDHGVTGFRPMLADLVRAASERSATNPASDAIAEIYGRDALPSVERALAGRRDVAERRRLTSLRDRLAAL